MQIQVTHFVHFERPVSHQWCDFYAFEKQDEIGLWKACVCPSILILGSDDDLHLDFKQSSSAASDSVEMSVGYTNWRHPRADRHIADEDDDACDDHCKSYGGADYAGNPN